MSKLKYFHPAIHEITVGYECEMRGLNEFDSEICCPNELYDHYCLTDKFNWIKHIITKKNLIELLKFPENGDLRNDEGHPIAGWYRTSYLTKEQIEAKGWKPTFDFKRDIMGEIAFDKPGTSDWGNYRLVVIYHEEIREMKIYFETQGRKKIVKYLGQCKDINQFNIISSLLNLP